MAEMTAALLRRKVNSNNLNNPSTGEMEESTNPNKKAAKFDRNSFKQILDQKATEIILQKGCEEDTLRRGENVDRLVVGSLLICIGLFVQFFPDKFPFYIPEKKRNVYLCMHYYLGSMAFVRWLLARQVFLFTAGKPRSSGLALSSKLSRYSDLYTLTISCAEAESSCGNPPVKLTKSITAWFASDGELLEDRYSKDVEGLVFDYVKESNKRGMWGSLLLFVVSVCCPRHTSLLVCSLHFFLLTMCVLKLVAMVP